MSLWSLERVKYAKLTHFKSNNKEKERANLSATPSLDRLGES